MTRTAAAMAEYDRRVKEANKPGGPGADYNALVSEVAEEYGLKAVTFARYVKQNTFTKPN